MRNTRPTKIVVSYRGSDKVKSYAALGLEPHGGHLHILSSTLGSVLPTVGILFMAPFCHWHKVPALCLVLKCPADPC